MAPTLLPSSRRRRPSSSRYSTRARSPRANEEWRVAATARPGFLARRHRSYYIFALPALIVVGLVIIFPWLFTVWMSAFDWKIGSVAHFVGLDNYTGLVRNQRFIESIVHTFYFTLLAVIVP